MLSKKSKLRTNKEIFSVLYDYISNPSNTTRSLAKKYKTSNHTISNILNNNFQKLEQIKQLIAAQCLDDALKAKKYITESKLRNTSAHSLVSMRRESVYTALMLLQNNLLQDTKLNNANIVQIILDTQKHLKE